MRNEVSRRAAEDFPADQPDHSKPGKRSAAAGRPESGEALVVATLRASDGSMLKIEAVDPGGARHDLSAEEAARPLGDRPKATMEGLVHEAFEAGIAYVLDDKTGKAAADDTSGETSEDAALHDELLDALIERSAAKRLLRREVLNSALLGTIISEACATGASGAE